MTRALTLRARPERSKFEIIMLATRRFLISLPLLLFIPYLLAVLLPSKIPAEPTPPNYIQNRRTKTGKNLEQWLSREGAEVECSLLLRVVEPGKWFSKIDGLPKPDFALLSAWLKPEYPSAQKSPRVIPEFLKRNFSMDGKIRVEYKYDNRAYLGGKAKYSEWTQELIEQKIQDAKNRMGNSYGEDGKQVFDVLAKYKEYIEGKGALVIGSETPWVEGGFLLYGAEKVTTLEFGSIISGHSKIETVLPYRNELYVVRVRVSDTFVRKYFRTFVQVKLSEIKLRRYESTTTVRVPSYEGTFESSC